MNGWMDDVWMDGWMMMIAVRRMVESGNMIIFGADMKAIKALARENKVDENVMVNKKTRMKTAMVFNDVLYKYPLWKIDGSRRTP